MVKEYKEHLILAEKAALVSGRFLIDLKKSEIEILDNSGKDIKLRADFESEKIIIEILKSGTDFPILTEESGNVNKDSGKDSKYKWIIDPLDGSFNYSRGVDLCCVSIALFKNHQPLMGVIYDFNNDELFNGLVGEGAWLNGIPIRTNNNSQKSSAVLATGFPISMDFSEEILLKYVKDFRQFKKIRMMGSAALSLAYVACGRYDIYKEDNIKTWDVAAGVALVKAAGGAFNLDGYPSSDIINVTAACSDEIMEFS